MNPFKRLALRLYGWLLGLYPASFRAEFSEEMRLVFALRLREDRGGWSVLRLVCRELRDLPTNLIRAYAQSRGGLITFAHTSRVQMLERALLLMLGSLLAVLLVGGISLVSDSAGPREQAVHGIAIGRYDGETVPVYISGRRLICDPTSTDRAATCTLDISGRRLEIDFVRNPEMDMNELDGTCTAVYAGQHWPCRVGARTVSEPWFACLDEPLGLGTADLNRLRQENPFQNLSEAQYQQAAGVVSGLLMAVVLGIVGLKLWQRARRWAIVAAPIATAFGVAGFLSLNWLLMIAFLGLGFID